MTLGGLPQGESVDSDFRQTLQQFGFQLDAGHELFILQDEAQSQAVVIVVVSVHVQPSGTPLFSVEFAHKTRDGTGLAAHMDMVRAMVARHSGACNVSSNLAEQAFFIKLLEQNVVPGVKCAHPVLRRSCIASPPPAAGASMSGRNADDKVCAFCGGAARLTCDACRGVHYCDAGCQKKHWKAHKPDCKGESKADGVSVVVDVVNKDLPGGIGVFSVMNMRQGAGTRTFNVGDVAHNPHGAQRFIIKVQVPQTAGMDPLMIYDEPRALQRMLFSQEGAAYGTVRDLVRARGVMNGAKAYLWARREGAQLRIFVDAAGMPDQRQPW
jgi:hypothetical protein